MGRRIRQAFIQRVVSTAHGLSAKWNDKPFILPGHIALETSDSTADFRRNHGPFQFTRMLGYYLSGVSTAASRVFTWLRESCVDLPESVSRPQQQQQQQQRQQQHATQVTERVESPVPATAAPDRAQR